jgi:hypothetical protein
LPYLDTFTKKCENTSLMDIKLGVLADYASITQEGKLNILGIFDTINAPGFPFVLPIFYVVVSYEAGAAEYGNTKNTEIVLCDEDGNELLRLLQSIQVSRPNRAGTMVTTNQIAGIVGFPFKKSGDYQFDILVNGDSKQTISLRINDAKQK